MCLVLKSKSLKQHNKKTEKKHSKARATPLRSLICFAFSSPSGRAQTSQHRLTRAARREADIRSLACAGVCVGGWIEAKNKEKLFLPPRREVFRGEQERSETSSLCSASCVCCSLSSFSLFFLSFILPFGALECSTLFLIVWWFL